MKHVILILTTRSDKKLNIALKDFIALMFGSNFLTLPYQHMPVKNVCLFGFPDNKPAEITNTQTC